MRLLILAALAVLFGGVAASQPAVVFRPVDDAQGWPGWRDELQQRVNEKARVRVNNFCVMIGDNGDGDPLLYAIWNNRLLYRWGQTTKSRIDNEVLIHHAPLDLRLDIVKKGPDRASTYLVTRSWARGIVQTCARSGQHLTLQKTR